MARMSIKGFEDVGKMLEGLSRPEKIAKEAVKAAAPVLEKNLKASVASAANRADKRGKLYSTGELEKHIKTTDALENERGVYAVVRPVGTDENGMRYAERMAYLEYGVASHNQAARPMLRRGAVAASESECIRIMEQVVSEEVDKL